MVCGANAWSVYRALISQRLMRIGQGQKRAPKILETHILVMDELIDRGERVVFWAHNPSSPLAG